MSADLKRGEVSWQEQSLVVEPGYTLNAPAHCPRAELASTSIFINFKCTHTQGQELITVEVG